MNTRDSHAPPRDDAVALFSTHGGQLRLSQALALGMNRYQFYKLRDEGITEKIGPGLYRLTGLPPVRDPDLSVVATKFPKAVLCLVSALSWHDLSTQIPRQIDLAVERHARLPKLDHPPVRGYRFSGKRFTAGIEHHDLDGSDLKVYSPEKTLADCFAFRNRIGSDIALEALQRYRQRGRPNVDKLLEFARICRVDKIIRPYLEATL